MRKDCIDPDRAEHIRTEDHGDRRRNALTDAAGSRDCAIHKCADGIRTAHDLDALHARRNALRLIGKKRKELPSERQQQSTPNSARDKGIAQADQIALHHALAVARALVSADKACACRMKRRHNVTL